MLSAPRLLDLFSCAGGAAMLGVDWMTAKEMTECVPPAYTEFLGHQLFSHVTERAA